MIHLALSGTSGSIIKNQYGCSEYLECVVRTSKQFCILLMIEYISNDSSFRQKHPGVPDSSDGSDRTSYPLTENYMLPVAQATCRVAYIPPLLFGDVYAHQNDRCVTRFAVMLKPFTQRLAMVLPVSGHRLFGNAAGAPGNRSYYLSFNDFQNLCI